MKQTSAVLKSDFEIIFDASGLLNSYLMHHLQIEESESTPLFSYGFYYQKKLIGGVLFSDYRLNHDVWLSIYSSDKRWCQRRVLRAVFDMAFQGLKCNRVSALVQESNRKSQDLLERLGFQKEGTLRSFKAQNQENCLIYSLLKNERRF